MFKKHFKHLVVITLKDKSISKEIILYYKLIHDKNIKKAQPGTDWKLTNKIKKKDYIKHKF
uniref:Uncharacterized protein n=1 Tax=Meloidogyne enterolobii TaxID=390850 RepID=A0A6V7VD80_MELEN|nr:unnamed protein product [Meloidogyne enterolobii]